MALPNMRMRKFAAFAGVFLSSTTVFAQEAPPPPPHEGPVAAQPREEATVHERHAGFEGGARLGVGIPLGKIQSSDDDAINSVLTATIPIWLDAGFRVNGTWYVGAYAVLAPGITNGTNCPDCSGANYKIGVNGHYHFIPEGKADPFLGFGLGYEVISVTQKGAITMGNTVDVTAKGWEVANVQFGVDIRLADFVRLRPFASFSLDVTTTESVSQGGVTRAATDLDTTLHEWLTFGVGGVFNP